MKKSRRISLTTKYVLIFGALLLAANILLGIVIVTQSAEAMSALVRKNMLDISNTAAGLVDGDILEFLDEENANGLSHSLVLHQLSVFQENIEIEYIYAVRQVDEDHFIFTVDADPEAPAEFGQEVLVTDALRQAAKGIAAVDEAPAEDEWGNFYTAYSPVLDSHGEIAGIIGVDFDVSWYQDQIRGNNLTIGLISILSVAACAWIVLMITRRVSRGFRELDSQLSALSADVVELTEEITSNPGYRESLEQAGEETAFQASAGSAGADEISELSEKIGSMQKELKRYLAYLHDQASTDPLTGIGNTAAYQSLLEALAEKIAAGSADFAVVVFDVDNLKLINDRYGHACGDMIIRGAAKSVARVFNPDLAFRIGGDEFLAVAEGMTEEEVRARLAQLDRAVEEFNAAEKLFPADLTLSRGAAVFRPGEDTSFRSVFIRADEDMYSNKRISHLRQNWEESPTARPLA